jgi:lyso-ornithine lipid O-acyltransferase
VPDANTFSKRLIDSLTAIRRLTHLLWVILHRLSIAKKNPTLHERALWQQKIAQGMLRALEVEVTLTGHIPQEGLLVSNHLSYLDAIVIAAQAPVVFVAKSEVIHWPLIGRLLKAAGTILANRHRRTSTGETAAEMRQAMECGLPVVFFPEGTSSNGSEVLPFKPALLQIALQIQKPITPAAISYAASSGDLAHDVCYWGDHTFASHIVRLAKIQNLTAHFIIGQTPTLPSDRKTAAQILHSEVSMLRKS